MRTSIYITGETNSVYSILNKIDRTYTEQEKDLRFGGKKLTFKTKQQATEALSHCRKRMAEERMNKDFNYYYKRGEVLSYDAGTAKIEKH